jgi:phosphate transport system substrate-binding protein
MVRRRPRPPADRKVEDDIDMKRALPKALVMTSALALALTACGGDDGSGTGQDTQLSGMIAVDGSSTVGPLTSVAAELFKEQQPNVNVTVGISGTGGGFEKFCTGETDISDASRPIEDDEKAACQAKGIQYSEFTMANDALTVVVNKDNTWATCLTVAELKKIWEPGSKINNWSQVRSGFPNERLTLAGPGTDSGTFDYFTDTINGEEGASRTDYSPSEDDNVTVQSVKGAKGGMGYFGFSYYEENQDTLKALEIDNGSGCVAPSVETAQDGSYAPLSRPLFIYPKAASLKEPEVLGFVEYYVANAEQIAEEAGFVPVNPTQKAKLQADLQKLKSSAGA